MVVAALSIIAVFAVRGGKDESSTPPIKAAPASATSTFQPTKAQWSQLQVGEVKLESFRGEIRTDGYLAYDDSTVTPVFSPYNGRVTRLLAQPGDIVKAGDPLFAMAASEFAQGRADLLAARAALDAASAQLANAESNAARVHALFEAEAAARKDSLQADADLATARSTRASAEAALGAVKDRLRILGLSEADILALEHRDAGAESSGDVVVRAPVAGSVIQRQAGVGQFVTTAAGGATQPVYSMARLSRLWLIANVREADAPRLRLGQILEAQLPAFPGRRLQGRVAWIAPAIDAATRRLAVRAEIDNVDGSLRPQMFANCSIVVSGERKAVAVPASAVVHEGDRARVFVVDARSAISPREVRLGEARGSLLEVTSGLNAGERVITGGSLFIDRALESPES
jgi:cobalt-zinc-cadmium efflux system membrane fusion protein